MNWGTEGEEPKIPKICEWLKWDYQADAIELLHIFSLIKHTRLMMPSQLAITWFQLFPQEFCAPPPLCLVVTFCSLNVYKICTYMRVRRPTCHPSTQIIPWMLSLVFVCITAEIPQIIRSSSGIAIRCSGTKGSKTSIWCCLFSTAVCSWERKNWNVMEKKWRVTFIGLAPKELSQEAMRTSGIGETTCFWMLLWVACRDDNTGMWYPTSKGRTAEQQLSNYWKLIQC